MKKATIVACLFCFILAGAYSGSLYAQYDTEGECGGGVPPARPLRRAQGQTYITDTDNEDNAHSGNPDGDMGGASPPCLFNDDTRAPTEFNIDVTGALPTTAATLTLYCWDVDEEGSPPEWDDVYFNGNFVGRLTGANNTWSTSVFPLNIGWVQAGNNLVMIDINTNPECDPGQWCVGVAWGQLLVDGGVAADASISSMAADDCYEIGPSVAVDVVFVIDVTQAGNFRLETNLVDPGNVTVDSDVYNFSPAPGTVNYTVNFSLGAASTPGTYTVNANLFDDDTEILQDVEVIRFAYVAVCGDISKIAILVRQASNDLNIYFWNAPVPGDWTGLDAYKRNPSPLARDFWQIPIGNDGVGLTSIDIR